MDSSAWYAIAVPSDTNHHSARRWFAQNTEPLLTTDYVVDETLTLLKVRGYLSAAIELGEALLVGELSDIIRITDSDFQQAWHIFRQHHDKGWSFTDCTSKAVMDRLGVQHALAFDRHFRQFGSVIVLPQ